MIRSTNLLLLLLLLCLPLTVANCGGGGGEPAPFEGLSGGTNDVPFEPDLPPPAPAPAPPAAPTPPGTTTTQPRVPRSATPPIGLTWNVGYTENATLAQLQGLYGKVLALNSALWNITEGQVYIYKVVISDNVGAGTTPSGWDADETTINTAQLDILIWPNTSWDYAGIAAYVMKWPSLGRTGLVMALPAGFSTDTMLHEAGHFIWDLSWAVSFGLEDEYSDGVQDASCNMERVSSKWCSETNHTAQTSQPHSCWKQILINYANFAHNDVDSAATTPWSTLVTYNDTP